jgi:hypothetical protein
LTSGLSDFISAFKKLFIAARIPVTKYYPGHQIRKNEMGWACVTYGRQERWIEGIGGNTERKKNAWKT